MAPRKQTTQAPGLAAELRQLRWDCMGYDLPASALLDHMVFNLRSPDLPEVHVVFQPPVTPAITMFMPGKSAGF